MLGAADSQPAQAGVAAAATAAAECGCSLLAGLVAVSAAGDDEEDDYTSAVKGEYPTTRPDIASWSSTTV
jgi:hypothetical protein